MGDGQDGGRRGETHPTPRSRRGRRGGGGVRRQRGDTGHDRQKSAGWGVHEGTREEEDREWVCARSGGDGPSTQWPKRPGHTRVVVTMARAKGRQAGSVENGSAEASLAASRSRAAV